ncbi:MAG TPA: hypothetical protein VJR89_23490 [Polyangiales bacterium]|nr:hypothetical protein [Polyangiales bacterium]
MIVRGFAMLCAAWLAWASTARAQEAESPGASPSLFWLSASATIVSASLGGFYALNVRNLYDEAMLTPTVSPRRAELHDEMRRAELTADLLLLGSLALAVGTTVLAFHVDWSGRDRAQPSAFALNAAGASFALDSRGPPPPRRAAARRSYW